MVQQRLRSGLVAGLTFGLVYAFSDIFVLFVLARWGMHIFWNPWNRTVFEMMGGMVGLGIVAGLVIAAISLDLNPRGAELQRQRIINRIPPLLVLTTLFTTSALQLIGLSLLGIGVSHALMLLLGRCFKRRRALGGIAVLMLFCTFVFVLSWDLPPAVVHHVNTLRPMPTAASPNILWIVMDTTRADHITGNSSERDTTPHLKRLADEGASFSRAYATAPWTLASHAAMFTGKYSSQHGCHHEHMYLDPSHLTIAELLKDSGYETALFSGNPWLDDSSGLSRGFDHVYSSWHPFSLRNLFLVGRFRLQAMPGGHDKGAAVSNRAFQEWLDQRSQPERPFFAFINYLEPHAPYHEIPQDERRQFLPSTVSDSDAKEISDKVMTKLTLGQDLTMPDGGTNILLDLYDASIHYTDQRVGEILTTLAHHSLDSNTVVIVNSDHGELFGEHGLYGHDLALYHSVLHVPLVIKFPGRIAAGTQVSNVVQLVDLFPTVAEFAGVSTRIPSTVAGVSLIPYLAHQPVAPRMAFAEFFAPQIPSLIREIEKMGMAPSSFRLKSIQSEDMRLIRWPSQESLFNIATDKQEKQDLVKKELESAEILRKNLDHFVDNFADSFDPTNPERIQVP